MQATLNIDTQAKIIPESCCKPQNTTPKWLKNVDIICRVALGIFAAWLAPLTFSVAFGLGALIGASYAIERYFREQPMFPNGESKPVCAQGYMDFLTGMRFPPVVSSLATATFIGAHMRHDPQFYVPFCAVFLGFWVGRESASLIRDMAGRSYSFVNSAFQIAESTPKKTCCHAAPAA